MNRNVEKASITVEASLVLPIFFFGTVAFLYLLQILVIQNEVQKGLFITAKWASRQAYTKQMLLKEKEETDIELLELGAIKIKLIDSLSKSTLNQSCVRGGVFGISIADSKILEEENDIYLKAVYVVHIPLPFFSLKNFKIVQAVHTKGFVGISMCGQKDSIEGGSEGQKQIVYITDTGSVYHLSKECSHLRLSIKNVYFYEIKTLRNTNGGKYKKCERCIKKETFQSMDCLYITENGDRYHKEFSCSGLKRTIKEVTIDTVGNRTECSRCGTKKK